MKVYHPEPTGSRHDVSVILDFGPNDLGRCTFSQWPTLTRASILYSDGETTSQTGGLALNVDECCLLIHHSGLELMGPRRAVNPYLRRRNQEQIEELNDPTTFANLDEEDFDDDDS